MLIDFEVGNFRSFNKPVRLSMVAANPIKDLQDRNTFEISGHQRLVKSAVIYGANASGKSNLFAAIGFVQKFVRISSTGMQIGDSIPLEPFKLDSDSEKRSSHFEVCFLIAQIRYRFGFEADNKAVTKEWLFRAEKMKEELLYLRDGDGIEVSDEFTEGKGLEEKTRNNALFLSVVAQFNGEISGTILKWFQGLVTLEGLRDQHYEKYTASLLKSEDYRNHLVKLIREADMGIEDLIVDEIAEGTSDQAAGQALKKTILKEPRISTIHAKFKDGKEESKVGLSFSDNESEGTKKFFRIAGPLIWCLEKGCVVFIDELDSKLHPLLTKAIVSMFNSTNPISKTAQLVFSTHDTNLLNKKIFRRDQIWFTEKDKYSATDLYSLAEFKSPEGKKVRNDADYETNYIEGRYGAIPFLGDFMTALGGGWQWVAQLNSVTKKRNGTLEETAPLVERLKPERYLSAFLLSAKAPKLNQTILHQ